MAGRNGRKTLTESSHRDNPVVDEGFSHAHFSDHYEGQIRTRKGERKKKLLTEENYYGNQRR